MNMERNPIETGLYRLKIVIWQGFKGLGLRGHGGRDESALQVAILDIFISYFGYGEIYTWFGTLLIL